MKSPWVVGVSFVLLASCAARQPGLSARDRAAVEAVLTTQRDAWNRGDLAAFMDGYARDQELVFTSGGRVRMGWERTRDAYQQRYGTDRASMGRLAFELLQVRAVGTRGAVVLGRWRLTDTPSAGGGVFTVVLERREGRWHIVHDHTSSDPPEPAPAP
ncbi:MAG: nuclear transport factor 2 family protein [Deltaproteobacteria bacterium]|nr:nuclear transport factor 2 family protein [Deltaproteobacteria bacterium]